MTDSPQTSGFNPGVPASASYGIDRVGDRWDRVGHGFDLWRYNDRQDLPPRTTAELVEYRSPIRWYDATGSPVSAGGRCGESVSQAGGTS